MRYYNSKRFYHRDELTEWLNNNQSVNVINITWLDGAWILFYFH